MTGNNMEHLVKQALAKFSEIAPKEDTVVEVTKKYAPLVKGMAKVIPVAEQGHIVLYTKDRRVRLDGSVANLIEANVSAIKTELLRSMQA